MSGDMRALLTVKVLSCQQVLIKLQDGWCMCRNKMTKTLGQGFVDQATVHNLNEMIIISVMCFL